MTAKVTPIITPAEDAADTEKYPTDLMSRRQNGRTKDKAGNKSHNYIQPCQTWLYTNELKTFILCMLLLAATMAKVSGAHSTLLSVNNIKTSLNAIMYLSKIISITRHDKAHRIGVCELHTCVNNNLVANK